MKRRANSIIEKLTRAAMSILHHDATETDSEARWEVEQLTKAFTKILKARPRAKRRKNRAVEGKVFVGVHGYESVPPMESPEGCVYPAWRKKANP